MTPLNAGARSLRPGGGNGQERLSGGEEKEEEEFPRGKPGERSSPLAPRDRTGLKAFPWQRPASGAADP